MNDADLTLIVDLVARRLPPEEERAALERVSADPELRSAYDAQRAVAARVSDVPAPTMTPTERRRLRTSLVAELRLDESPPARRAPRRSRWFALAGSFAAAAVVIVGAIAILPNVLSSSSSADLALQKESVATTAVTDGASSEPELEAAAAAPVGGTIETTDAASFTDAAAGAADEAAPAVLPPLPYVPDLSLDRLASSYASDPGLSGELAARSSTAPAGTQEAAVSCLDEVLTRFPDSPVAAVAVTRLDGDDTLVVAISPPGEETYLAAFSLPGCRRLPDTRE